MKELNLKRNLEYLENAEIIEDYYQNVSQYENYGVKLWRVGKAVIYSEDLSVSSNNWLLEEEEKKEALENPEEFLKSCINEWVSNEDDPELAEYQWYPELVRGCVYKGDGECKILVVGWYNGYQPVNWLTDDCGDTISFESSTQAQNWIDEVDNNIYHLSHNEAGRPDYYIIEA